MAITHTIISWDCCFRNFFHLIPSLLEQCYELQKIEVIFVEQRSREQANDVNRPHRLKTLEDWTRICEGKLNLRVLYLDIPNSEPYHLGRLVNKGLEHAEGEIVSVMDGDQIVPRNFLAFLEKLTVENHAPLFTLYRKMARFPVGVITFADWMVASSGYKCVLDACPDKWFIPYSSMLVNNYGPMVSAKREDWEKMGGYDEGMLWATSASTLHADASARLLLVTKTRCTTLPLLASVHPWHPVGYANKQRGNERSVNMYLGFQRKLTSLSMRKNIANWRIRVPFQSRLYSENKSLCCSLVQEELEENRTWQHDPKLSEPVEPTRKILRSQQRHGLSRLPFNLYRCFRSRDFVWLGFILRSQLDHA